MNLRLGKLSLALTFLTGLDDDRLERGVPASRRLGVHFGGRLICSDSAELYRSAMNWQLLTYYKYFVRYILIQMKIPSK